MKRILSALVLLLSVSAYAGQGQYPYVIGTDHGTRNSATIQKIMDSSPQKLNIVLDGGVWNITNNLTINPGHKIVIPWGSSMNVYTGFVVNFVCAQLEAGNYAIFSGNGVLTGSVNCVTLLTNGDGLWKTGFTGTDYLVQCYEHIDGGDIFDNSITSDDLGPDSVGNSEVADNAIGSPEIIDRSVRTNDIAEGGVDGYNILDGTVTTNDLAQPTIDELGDGAIDRRFTEDYDLYRFGMPRITISTNDITAYTTVVGATVPAAGSADLAVIVDGDLSTKQAISYDIYSDSIADTNDRYAVTGDPDAHVYCVDLGEQMSGWYAVAFRGFLSVSGVSGASLSNPTAVMGVHPSTVPYTPGRTNQSGSVGHPMTVPAYWFTTGQAIGATPYHFGDADTKVVSGLFEGRYVDVVFQVSYENETIEYKMHEIFIWAVPATNVWANLGGLPVGAP